MFPEKPTQKTAATTNVEKQFLGIHKSTNCLWWKEQISYLFIPASQITEIKLVTATDGSYNVYARVNLLDRFEYFLIDNKKTLSAAKKLAEEFIIMIQEAKTNKEVSDKKQEKNKEESPNKKQEKTNGKKQESNLNGAEALVVLMEDLKPGDKNIET